MNKRRSVILELPCTEQMMRMGLILIESNDAMMSINLVMIELNDEIMNIALAMMTGGPHFHLASIFTVAFCPVNPGQVSRLSCELVNLT